MSLAPFVQILGRGPGRSRSLTQSEARAAMGVILAGDAAPEAVGALLMLLRMKGETAEELAGFVQAARAGLQGWDGVAPALDWPSYAAGRTRGLPWFLLAARMVAQAGYPVLLHGWTAQAGGLADVRQGCAALGIAVTRSPQATQAALATAGIAYLPLETLSQPLLDLLRLRSVLGLRSCINTVLRLLNPCGAAASVQGVFHPSYRIVQTDACLLLGARQMSVIKGGGGEFERHPLKQIDAYGLRDGAAWQHSFAPLQDGEARRLASPALPLAPETTAERPEDLMALWSGERQDDFAQAVVVGTAALALDTLGAAAPEALAAQLWTDRHRMRAA